MTKSAGDRTAIHPIPRSVHKCWGLTHLSPLITGHSTPIEGAERIAEEVTACGDSMQPFTYRRRKMSAGSYLYKHRLCSVNVTPSNLDVREGLRPNVVERTSPSGRCTKTGWFQHGYSTPKLYGVAAAFHRRRPSCTPRRTDALVTAARPTQRLGAQFRRFHLTDLVLANRTRPRRGPRARFDHTITAGADNR